MLNTSIPCPNRFTGGSNSKGRTYLKERVRLLKLTTTSLSWIVLSTIRLKAVPISRSLQCYSLHWQCLTPGKSQLFGQILTISELHLSKNNAALEWFPTVVTSGPTRKFPNWGVLSRIALKVLKSSASSSVDTDLLKYVLKWSGSIIKKQSNERKGV